MFELKLKYPVINFTCRESFRDFSFKFVTDTTCLTEKGPLAFLFSDISMLFKGVTDVSRKFFLTVSVIFLII